MTCYHVVTVHLSEHGDVLFGKSFYESGLQPLHLPCGTCFGCRMDRARDWSIRAQHEASIWRENCFLTLTYDDEHLPEHATLVREHPQKFLRALRRRFAGVRVASDGRQPIRFFGCGEYGSKTDRPHYHILLFNWQPEDKKRYDSELYTSEAVSKLWEYGSVLIGDVEPASCAYVAGYVTKKCYGRIERELRFEVVDEETGEVLEPRVPDFTMCSLRPAVGASWYEKYKMDLRHGYVIANGSKYPIPRFYWKKLKEDFPELAEDIGFKRYEYSRSLDPAERTEARMQVRELVARAKKRFYGRDTVMESV